MSRVRIAVAAAAMACALVVPLKLSADVWAYAAYGALLSDGVDPWAHAYRAGAVAPLHDPVVDAALRAWDGSLPRDVYGPLFTLPVAAAVTMLRPLGPAATALALRVGAAASLLLCIALAARQRPALARMLAAHPVVLWCAAEGHNDAYWLAIVLAADGLRAGPRIVALSAAAAVKAVAVVPLAAAVARLPRNRRALATAAAAALTLIAYAPLLRGVLAHGFDAPAGAPRISLVHGAALAEWSASPVPVVLAALLGLAAVAAAVRALRSGDLLAGGVLTAWVALPAPEPWYAVWLLPVIALGTGTPASRALLAASFTGAIGYVQDLAPGTALRDPALLGGTMVAMYALPLLVALLAPGPSPAPQPPPAVAPTASAAPSPAATTTPVPPSPSPSAAASPNPFAYVVTPEQSGSATPRIVEIALNDRVIHQGGMLLVRVTTSPDVTSVIARALGREIAIPQGAPGYFAGQEQLPSSIPFFFLNRTYQIDVVASTADGHTARYKVPLRLER